ncbi:uncharacterized protein LOC124359100 [Homalodisca vitripennis]|uniref:uncharacterized protein LOC124359100 n=1 Tax=Homalodisca vitripennis TaxID=197043 RepID=UPI001EEAAD5A|nr:uncharacterized protein LOC124359100 [Homalodisca vitripennis]
MGVSISSPKINSVVLVFISFISGVFGDPFDDDMITSRNIMMVLFAVVAFVFLLTFIVILCRVCTAFRQVERCHHHADHHTPAPVVISLPPQNTVSGGYPKPPPYSAALPSAPPPYGFNPEINPQSGKTNYF